MNEIEMTPVRQAIVDALPAWGPDADEWATRGDVANVPAVQDVAATKTVGNNLAQLVAAGIVEKTTAANGRTALYRTSREFAEQQNDVVQSDDRCESEGCDIPDGYSECRLCGAEAVPDDVPPHVFMGRVPVDGETVPDPEPLPAGFTDAVDGDDVPATLRGALPVPAADPEPLPDPCRHEWVAGMAIVSDEDVESVAATGRHVECSQCGEYYRPPTPAARPAETAADEPLLRRVDADTPAPSAPVSGDLGAVAAFMSAVRPVSAPPAPAPRARRQRAGDGERPAWRVFAPGELNAEVAAFLANLLPAEQQTGVTPTVVAKALNAQTGSVAFACMKLTERGAARQTSAKPKRYAAPA